MGRNIWIEGLTLRSRRFQEFHKDVTILCRTGGILQAVLHGGYKGKSRLAGATEPFRQAEFLLYHNPVKQSYKISDGDVLNPFEELRGNLAKIYLASLWSEIMIKTQGMGAHDYEGERVFFLILGALELIEELPDRDLPVLNIQFLWRLLETAGLSIDFQTCVSCGKNITGRAGAVFSSGEKGFFCGTCGAGDFSIGREVRRLLVTEVGLQYLKDSLGRGMSEAVKVPLNPAERLILERIPLLFMVTEMDFKLKTTDYHPFLNSD